MVQVEYPEWDPGLDSFGLGVYILYPQNNEGRSKHEGHTHFTQ